MLVPAVAIVEMNDNLDQEKDKINDGVCLSFVCVHYSIVIVRYFYHHVQSCTLILCANFINMYLDFVFIMT